MTYIKFTANLTFSILLFLIGIYAVFDKDIEWKETSVIVVTFIYSIFAMWI